MSCFLHEIEGDLHALSPGGIEFALGQRTMAFKSVENRGAKHRIAGEYLFRGAAQQFLARTPEESFDRCAHQYDPGIAGEQHEPVLELGHQLIDIVFQSGENFFRIAHLAAQVGDFQSNHQPNSSCRDSSA